MNEEFKTVVRAFQADVQRGLALFRQHRGLNNIRAWRDHGLSQTGYLDTEEKHYYFFHGIGCELQLSPDTHIDWDFGHGGRMDGFDHWRLKQFIEERPDIQRVLPLEKLRVAFDIAVREGSIVSPWRAQNDSLYYVADDLQLAGVIS